MFQNYTRATTTSQVGTLDLSARNIKATQIEILSTRLKTSTGTLIGSINIKEPDTFTREIGPDLSQAPYAPIIEEGRSGTSFTGYHYVRDSLDRNQLTFVRRLERAIERPT